MRSATTSPLRALGARAALAATVALVACGADEGEPLAPLLVEGDGCQPLLASTAPDDATRALCVLPYPSDFHVVADATTATGRRVALGAAAVPTTKAGAPSDPHVVVPTDGFSLVPTIVATLPSAVVRDGLPGILDDPAASATAASATLIVDTATGALVPHYVDVARAADDLHQPLVLRTFAPLAPRTRYVVALRGVRASGGGAPLAAPPEGFRRLRDRELNAARDPALAAVATRFDADVFAPLERAGVARSDLQLAWDFTTGSAEEPMRDMLAVRELTLAWLATHEPAVTITSATDGAGAYHRVVEGTIEAPLFLESPAPMARLFRGAGGVVVQNGTTTFRFRVSVPRSALAGPPGRLLAFGHGFFGDSIEMVDSEVGQILGERVRAVQIALDWWGMSREDVGAVIDAIGTRPAHVTDFAERVHQAMANWLVAIAAMRGPMTKLPDLQRPDATPAYDPAFVGYFGASQGHILGGTLVALAPDISRAVLNVGGGGFTHLMPRSANFGPFSLALDATFNDPLLVQAFIGMMQRPLDRIDPLTYAPLVTRAPLPGSTYDRRVLLQIGVGDAHVPHIGAYLHARALGAGLDAPSPRSVFGLEPLADGARAGMTLFDFGIDTSAWAEPSPLPPNVVHQGVRVNAGAVRQMEALLKPDGVIVHGCDGPCDPE